MGYRPTGRPAGRPRGPVTPDGKLTQARKTLPHVKAFPEMARAVDRVMRVPNQVVMRDWTADSRDVDVLHHYTPAERGQILSFVWWVYVNRSAWPRRKLTAAVSAVSPLMLFSSSFLAEMTGIPQSTATKQMIKPPDMKVTRITGTCDPWVVQQLLDAATHGEDEFRELVRELCLTKGIPKAFLSRMSGVPVSGILRPERGVQFYPEKPDWESGQICSTETRDAYWKYHPGEKKTYDPRPGDQRPVRDSIPGTPLGDIRATSTPVPSENHLPFHLCIPGLPRLRKGQVADDAYFERIRDWEFTYHLRASTGLGSSAAG